MQQLRTVYERVRSGLQAMSRSRKRHMTFCLVLTLARTSRANRQPSERELERDRVICLSLSTSRHVTARYRGPFLASLLVGISGEGDVERGTRRREAEKTENKKLRVI